MGQPINGQQPGGQQPGEISVELADLCQAQQNQLGMQTQQLMMQAAHILRLTRERDGYAKNLSEFMAKHQGAGCGVAAGEPGSAVTNVDGGDGVTDPYVAPEWTEPVPR